MLLLRTWSAYVMDGWVRALNVEDDSLADVNISGADHILDRLN